MSLRFTTHARLCPRCGYDLSQVDQSQLVGECPSCGGAFDTGAGKRSRRWPRTWVVGAALCGPMIALALLYMGSWLLSRSGPNGSAFFKELVPILRQGALPVWILTPIFGACMLVRRYAYASERWTLGIGMSLLGIIGNAVIAMLLLLLAAFMR